MILHYLRVAWRSFRRHAWYSLINIACLAIGLAAVMTIMLYILHEHSYDRWHANASRIFAVSTPTSYGSSNWTSYQLTYPVGPAAAAANPGVESMVRVKPADDGADLQNPASPASRFHETSLFIYADSNFFRFFSFRLLRGNPERVLSKPFDVVLTEKAAKKYFGNADPIGKTLMLDKQYPLQVTGVAADMPSNTSLEFELVASLSTMSALDKYKPWLGVQQLESGEFSTWLLLRKAGDTANVARNLAHLAVVAVGEKPRNEMAYGLTESHRFILLPLEKTHLGAYEGYHGKYLNVFTWVAVLILLLALVNYMSLATARSAMRAREVGVRKVIGAGRAKIAGQFYTESALYAVIAFAAGLLLFLAFRRGFCNLMQLPIDVGFLTTSRVMMAFAALLVFVIAAGGSYPSLVLSSFRPVAVLYGKLSRQRGGERIRKGFLVFQFSLSMALMTCAFIVGKELFYLRHTDTGVNRENIVLLPFGRTMEHYAPYLKEIEAIPGITQVATTKYKLYEGGTMVQLAKLHGKATSDPLSFMITDSNFIPLLGLKWKEKPDPAGDWLGRHYLVLNEAAVDAFHIAGRATGTSFTFGDSLLRVSGVVKNFNFHSLHMAIEPLGIRVARRVEDEWDSGLDGVLYAKIAPHVNMPALIEAIHRVYSQYDDRTAFEFSFLDDAFNSQYKSEDQLAALMSIFTGITILIACLGLFALATFAAQQRLKEIGIRKVLGASVTSISVLLSRDFLRPIILSVLIASPLAWWVMHKWLQSFAYRTPISWWIFPAVGGGLLLIAQLTVLFRTIKAAQVNPTINLRSE